MQCDETEAFKRRARSLLVVVSTPPTENYENFTKIVREYNAKEPFNFTTPSLFHINNISKVWIFDILWFMFIPWRPYFQYVSIYAAYLYDSVKLYAWALDQLLRREKDPLTDDKIYEVASNGTRIIETIIQNRTYKSKYFGLIMLLFSCPK